MRPPASPPQELALPARGLTLAARAWGPVDGRPVLALHGWLDNAASFDRLAPLLPGLRLIALDLPGHGRSAHRGPGASYDLLTYVPDVVEVLDGLGWQRCALIGHSLGSAIACCLAGALPDRVDALVALDALGPMTAEPEQTPARLAEVLAVGARRRARPPRVFADLDAAVEARVRSSGMSRAVARCIAERDTRPAAGGLVWRHDPRLRVPSLLRLTEAHTLAFLRRVTCPVLMVRSDDGFPFFETVLPARLAALPRAERLNVSGGHHAHADTPELIAPRVLRFLTTA